MGKTSYALLIEPTTKMTSHPTSLGPNGLPMFVDRTGPTIVCKQFGKNIHLLFWCVYKCELGGVRFTDV
jgi:hypothetical protein